MIHKIGIKNFRVFKKKTTIEFTPITILTGTNSSGKSSIVKALELLSYNLISKSKDIDAITKLNFRDQHTLLGGFSKVISRNTSSNFFNFFFYYNSNTLLQKVSIELRYIKASDSLKNTKELGFNDAELDSIIFYDNSEKEILTVHHDKNFYDHKKMEYDTNQFNSIPWVITVNYEKLYSLLESNVKTGYQHFQYLNILDKLESKTKLDDAERKVLAELSEKGYEIVPKEEDMSFPTLIRAGSHRFVIKNKDTGEIQNPNIKYLNYFYKYFGYPVLFLPDHINELLLQFSATFFKNKDKYLQLKNTKDGEVFLILEEFCEQNNLQSEDELIRALKSIDIDLFKAIFDHLYELILDIPKNYEYYSFELDLENILSKLSSVVSNFKNPSNNYFNPFEQLISISSSVNYPSDKDIHKIYSYKKDNKKRSLEEKMISKNPKNSKKRSAHNFTKLIQLIGELMEEGFKNVINLSDFQYIGSGRTLSNRVILDNDKSDIAQNYYKYISHINKKDREDNERAINFVKKWIKTFDIADNIDLVIDDDGAWIKAYLIKDNKKELINDVGLGINQLFPLILRVSINPIRVFKNSKRYGGTKSFLSQNFIFIEEPEANLHPSFQSKLADFFVDAIKEFDINFVIETHSEYFIRKLQYLTAKKEISPEDVIIYYFHHPDNIPKGEKQVKELKIESDGSLSDDFGPGFFDESTNIKFDLLRLKLN